MRMISTRSLQAAPGSFAAQPVVTWRAGSRYARVVDQRSQLHGLLVVDEPNVWVINLEDKSGRHIVDSGPSYKVHIPVFPPKLAGERLKELELGDELSFFADHSATKSREVINGVETERYDLTVGQRATTLWVDVKSQKPVRIALKGDGQPITLEYTAYDDLPFDETLFRPPAGIRMVNVRSH